eukprot:scaffold8585_cov258-Pinguiococcus_pyrenoidosus.AAC.2
MPQDRRLRHAHAENVVLGPECRDEGHAAAHGLRGQARNETCLRGTVPVRELAAQNRTANGDEKDIAIKRVLHQHGLRLATGGRKHHGVHRGQLRAGVVYKLLTVILVVPEARLYGSRRKADLQRSGRTDRHEERNRRRERSNGVEPCRGQVQDGAVRFPADVVRIVLPVGHQERPLQPWLSGPEEVEGFLIEDALRSVLGHIAVLGPSDRRWLKPGRHHGTEDVRLPRLVAKPHREAIAGGRGGEGERLKRRSQA